jgi:hypothetical protein
MPGNMFFQYPPGTILLPSIFFIGYPIKGTFDVVGFLGAFVVALPLAYTQMLKRHVAMDFMTTHGSNTVKVIAHSIVHLLGIAIYGLIAWRCFVLGTKFLTVGRVSDTIALPIIRSYTW